VFSADCAVPKLKGLRVGAANRALKAGHCGLASVKHAFSKKVRKRHVISQKPKAGTFLARDAKVKIVLSKGKRHSR
jgi:beta-lactam-binding protein with PASTA domain